MMRLALIPLLLLVPLRAGAQEPVVRMELSEGSVVVGQQLVLRVTILVPTFMPDPPVYPSFDLPNLTVRLPERATTPVSERIDGASWSGTSRGYRMTPLIAGRFEIPPQSVTVTYADPDTNAPAVVSLPTPAVQFSGTVPEGAQGLDPLIVAESFALTQTLEIAEGALAVGDVVERRIEAKIGGTTAMMIPVLIPALPLNAQALRAYPREPVIGEASQRGEVSGTRGEAVTYVAQAGGGAELLPVSLQWFNLGSGKVETAEVPGAAVEVTEPAVKREIDWKLIVALLAAVVAMALVWRWLGPRVRVWVADLKARRHQSEPYAFRGLRRAVSARDLTQTMSGIDDWRTRFDAGEPPTAVRDALLAIGAAAYRPDTEGTGSTAVWGDLGRALAAWRKTMKKRQSGRGDRLPPLNPV